MFGVGTELFHVCTLVCIFQFLLTTLQYMRAFNNEIIVHKGCPGGSDIKESACNVGDLGSIPGSGSSLEKGMATQLSILAWRIPWTEKPGGLQFMGSQRVRHD